MHDDRSTARFDRRLRLDADAGLIAGVCAGLARYLRTDVAFVRIAALVAAIFLPQLVLAAYLITWFLLARREAGWAGRRPWRTSYTRGRHRP
jgi:phage shock protein PspC (stress-responsive transcriptional regulator)